MYGRECGTQQKEEKIGENGWKMGEIVLFFRQVLYNPREIGDKWSGNCSIFQILRWDGVCGQGWIVPIRGIGKPAFKAMEWCVPRGTTAQVCPDSVDGSAGVGDGQPEWVETAKMAREAGSWNGNEEVGTGRYSLATFFTAHATFFRPSQPFYAYRTVSAYRTDSIYQNAFMPRNISR